MATQTETIEFGETRIAYSIRCSERRKTIAITVTAEGEVEVIAPRGLIKSRVAQAVHAKSAWIVRKQEENRQFLMAPAREMASGESIRYLGRQYQLKHISEDGSGVRLKFSPDRVEIRMPENWPRKERAAAAKAALETWYRSRLGMIAVPIANRYVDQIGETFSVIRVRKLGHRWGSCGKGRTLYFNWRLAMAPIPLIEFVVAHEVCHLRHSDHSQDFFRLLARILPDWESRKVRLDREGPRFQL